MTSYSSLLSVAVGAILASTGGFISGRLTARVEQRRRARFAAMIGREVLSSLLHIVTTLKGIHDRGDPFGRLTMRFIRSARREVELYERNREAMFDLGDERLRFQLHDLMIRLSIPLDFLIDEIQGVTNAPPSASSAMEETFQVFMRHCTEISSMINRLNNDL